MKKNDHMPAAASRSRISLGMVMIVVLSIGIFAGLYSPGRTEAAVTALDAWSEVYSANPGATTGTLTSNNFTVSATGSNKLLAVGICWEFGTTGTMLINGATLDVRLDTSTGAQFTQIGLTSVAGAEHCYAGYLPEAQFTSGTHAIYVSWAATTTTTNCSGLSVMTGSYQGVAQTSTVNSTAASNANTATITLGSNVAYTADSVTLFVTANGGTALTTVTKTAPNFTQQLQGANTLQSPFIADAANASSGTYPSTDVITFSGATVRNRAAVVAGVLNPASASTPGITVNPTSGLTTTEAGGTAQFTIVLDSAPTNNVSINLSSSDTSEGTVSPASVTFTSGNWSTAQTVTVTGVDDAVVDGNIAYTIITAAASSADSNYSGLNASDVSVTNTDDDVAGSPGITVNPTSGLTTTEAGGTAQFTIVLDSAPTNNVTINLSSSITSEGTVAPTSVTFTSGNWSTSQTVTVTGVDDAIVDGNIAYSIITAAATSTDGNYNGLNASDVAVTNMDNDGAPPPVPVGNWPLFIIVVAGMISYGMVWRKRQDKKIS
ncbi:MAG: hypothetical protein C0402_04695 [Thermodesulfovibrio sp.]|nr:hypothetical protein [Thermodesulfovibrio sp.]